MQTLPINLSLSEDERSPNNRSGSGGGGGGGNGSDQSLTSPHLNKTLAASGGGGGFGQTVAGANNNPDQSPLETADMLYEYFPLSLDDW